jgi:hypothetical protein
MKPTPDTAVARSMRLATAFLRRLRDEHAGWALIEVIMAAGIMIVVLSASLLTFEMLVTNQGTAAARYDSQDKARAALESLSRDLRNVSGVSTGAQVIDQSGPYDLIFRTINPAGPPSGQNSTNLQRVRYCIDNANPAAEKLILEVQTWSGSTPPPVPPTNTCTISDTGWASTRLYADGITNQNNGATRPVFSYTSSNGAIIAVHADLYDNAKPKAAALETHLSTGVFLRNQDVPPTGAFTATAGTGYITLDGSSSISPQGSPLTYVWYDGAVKIGQGIVFSYTIDPSTNAPLKSGSSHTISLKTYDPAGLEGDAPAKTVTVL